MEWYSMILHGIGMLLNCIAWYSTVQSEPLNVALAVGWVKTQKSEVAPVCKSSYQEVFLCPHTILLLCNPRNTLPPSAHLKLKVISQTFSWSLPWRGLKIGKMGLMFGNCATLLVYSRWTPSFLNHIQANPELQIDTIKVILSDFHATDGGLGENLTIV